MKRISILSALLLMCAMTFAQQALWGGAPVVSPEIHDNNTVTFRLKAPKAVKVQVTGDFLPTQKIKTPFGEFDGPGVADLKENKDGVWEFTTPEPLKPELYSYTFLVDGLKINDPANVYMIRDVASVTAHIGIYNHVIDTEDMTASLITFKSGAAATFVSTTCAYPGISTDIQIYGTNGSIEADQDKLKTWKMKEFDEAFAEKMGIDAFDTEEEEAFMLEKYGNGNPPIVNAHPEILVGHRYMVEDMICAVLEDRDPAILPTEAMKSVRIVNAVYESAKTGKTIVF